MRKVWEWLAGALIGIVLGLSSAILGYVIIFFLIVGIPGTNLDNFADRAIIVGIVVGPLGVLLGAGIGLYISHRRRRKPPV